MVTMDTAPRWTDTGCLYSVGNQVKDKFMQFSTNFGKLICCQILFFIGAKGEPGNEASQALLFLLTMPGYKTSNLQSYLSSILHSGGGISSLLSSLTTGTNVTYTPQCRYMIKEWSMMKSWIHIRKCIGTLYLDFGTGGLYLFIRSVSDTRTWSIWRKKQPISKI